MNSLFKIACTLRLSIESSGPVSREYENSGKENHDGKERIDWAGFHAPRLRNVQEAVKQATSSVG